MRPACSAKGSHGFLLGLLLILALAVLVPLHTGCASGQASHSLQFSGTTNVILLASSTGGDEPYAFEVGLASLTLENDAGKSVTVLNYPNCQNGTITSFPCLDVEFMHLNARQSLPLVTVSVPQDNYTSATLTVGACGFQTLGVSSIGGFGSAWYFDGLCEMGTPEAGEATVNLPTPITITGSSMFLSLNLQVPQSYTLTGTGCTLGGGGGPPLPCSYTISPVFTLAPLQIAAAPTNAQNGLEASISAVIDSVSESSFTADTTDAASVTFSTSPDTQYQGIAELSSLKQGMFVQVDAALQPDGSLVATRLETDDPTAVFWGSGLIQSTYPPFGTFDFQTGWSAGFPPGWGPCGRYDTTNTIFKVSSEFTSLNSLPFTPAFDLLSMFPGQNIATFLSSPTCTSNPPPPADTVVLMPQTMNGTVSSISMSNGFTVYTVNLASNDMIANLQGLVGLYSPLNNPSAVFVYTDPHTQVLTTDEINDGSIERFHGLIFNDNGTLRMDCDEILPGVTQ
jgi:hypothetical protein